MIGVSAGAKAELNLLALMGKRARIHGSTLRARSLEEKALAARHLEREVLPLFEADAGSGGSAKPATGGPSKPTGDASKPPLFVPIAETFPLEDVAAAYDHFAAGGKLGKIVLAI